MTDGILASKWFNVNGITLPGSVFFSTLASASVKRVDSAAFYDFEVHHKLHSLIVSTDLESGTRLTFDKGITRVTSGEFTGDDSQNVYRQDKDSLASVSRYFTYYSRENIIERIGVSFIYSCDEYWINFFYKQEGLGNYGLPSDVVRRALQRSNKAQEYLDNNVPHHSYIQQLKLTNLSLSKLPAAFIAKYDIKLPIIKPLEKETCENLQEIQSADDEYQKLGKYELFYNQKGEIRHEWQGYPGFVPTHHLKQVLAEFVSTTKQERIVKQMKQGDLDVHELFNENYASTTFHDKHYADSCPRSCEFGINSLLQNYRKTVNLVTTRIQTLSSNLPSEEVSYYTLRY